MCFHCHLEVHQIIFMMILLRWVHSEPFKMVSL
ncbi:hypothetical protein LINPERHAP2_LOCUS38087 [Linum perenne]